MIFEFTQKSFPIVVMRITQLLNTLKSTATYTLEIKEKKNKRSNEANRLCWELCTRIASALQDSGVFTFKEDIYREHIKATATEDYFEDVEVLNKAVDDLIKYWGEKGIGWFGEKIDEGSFGKSVIRLYVGSSKYDTKQQSKLISSLMETARQLDVEIIDDRIQSLLNDLESDQ